MCRFKLKRARVLPAHFTPSAAFRHVAAAAHNPPMETKWLEDFVSLAETRSFSRSAQLRHVTQPAFSRRIQALEAWAGTDLVDRSSYPTRLTPAGQTLYNQSLEMLQGLQSTRAMLRGHTSAGAGRHRIRRAAHAGLHLLSGLGQQPAREVRPDQEPADRAQCARRGAAPGRGQLRPADCLPPRLAAVPARSPTATKWCRWARKCWRRFAGPMPPAQPEFRLPGRAGQPLPYLGYAPGAYLGRVVDLILKQSATAIHLDRVYETDMAEGLKAMALEGHGMAFLPLSAVQERAARQKAGQRRQRPGDDHGRARLPRAAHRRETPPKRQRRRCGPICRRRPPAQLERSARPAMVHAVRWAQAAQAGSADAYVRFLLRGLDVL